MDEERILGGYREMSVSSRRGRARPALIQGAASSAPTRFFHGQVVDISKIPGYELITNCDRLRRPLKHTPKSYLPYTFTEQGVAMLSSVLNSEKAILVNIEIMRAFTRLRQLISTHKDLERKINILEKKYDEKFQLVFEAIRQLLQPPDEPSNRIGFR
jgi:hypothetical protein